MSDLIDIMIDELEKTTKDSEQERIPLHIQDEPPHRREPTKEKKQEKRVIIIDI